jgi:L-fucose isomerase-like protein
MRYPISRPPTLAVIYGNRDFFPDHLVAEARADIAKLFGQLGINAMGEKPGSCSR